MTKTTGDRTAGHHDRDKLCLEVDEVIVMTDDNITEQHAMTPLSSMP